MRFPEGLSATVLGLAAQVPIEPISHPLATSMSPAAFNFSLKTDANIFSPKDLVELARPGTGVANSVGDLALIPVSTYSLQDKKCVHRP